MNSSSWEWNPHVRTDGSIEETGRILRRQIDAFTPTNRFKLPLWIIRAIRNPKFINFTVKRLKRFRRGDAVLLPEKVTDNFPKSVGRVLNLFRAHIGNGLNERAGSSESLGSQARSERVAVLSGGSDGALKTQRKAVCERSALLLQHQPDRALRWSAAQSPRAPVIFWTGSEIF